jgi:uncharacterized protein
VSENTDQIATDMAALHALVAAVSVERDAAIAERDAAIAECDQALSQSARRHQLPVLPLSRRANRRAYALGEARQNSDPCHAAGRSMTTTTSATAIAPAILLSPPPPQISMSPLELDGYLTGIIVTPQAAPIRPSAWIARLWSDAALLADVEQLEGALGTVLMRYSILLRDIDRSLTRMEADRIVDYRPLFLPGDERPAHDAVRAWVRGFWKAMELAPEIWNALIDDERTKIVIAPFVGFFDVGTLEPHQIPDDIDDRLDEDAALIPRMVLVLRKLARIREADSRPSPFLRRSKVGRNDPCPCGSGKKYKRCCGRA